MKVGLVLEGGAMRGMFTAGVLDTFIKHNIKFDIVVGVSAGALFGVNYLSKQSGRVIRYNKRFNRDKKYIGIRPLLQEGNIVNTKYAYDDVPKKLDAFDDETFRNSNVPFYAVITDIETGKPEYVQIKSVFNQMDTLRASGSMPFVSKPVIVDGKKYLDGGISDSIPYEWLLNQGCDKVVVILTRDMEYKKAAIPKFPVKLYYNKYPCVYNRLAQRHNEYNNSVKNLLDLEKTGKAFVVRPSKPISVSLVERNPNMLQDVYELGLTDAEKEILKLKEFLK